VCRRGNDGTIKSGLANGIILLRELSTFCAAGRKEVYVDDDDETRARVEEKGVMPLL